MQVGVQQLFQNTGDPSSDRDRYQEELRLARLIEPLGYDSVWGVEHHFSGYSMTPNVLQFLAYMAGATERIELGSMVIVLPWHNPVRVADEVSQLDNLSDGRVILGVGRGLGRLEFDGIGVPMDESRERFVEAAQLILEGLEQGRVAFQGEHYRQPPRDLRPRPVRSFRGRTWAAAVSPESMRIMAELGVAILIIPQKPWPMVAEDLRNYRRVFREVTGEAAPPTLVTSPVFCDPDPKRAEVEARRHISDYYRSVVAHYELTGDHFEKTRGYEFYAENKAAMDSRSESKTVGFYVDLQVWGTPDQCYEKVVKLQKKVGMDYFVPNFHFAGVSGEEAERNMRMFAADVLPRLKALPPLSAEQADPA